MLQVKELIVKTLIEDIIPGLECNGCKEPIKLDNCWCDEDAVGFWHEECLREELNS